MKILQRLLKKVEKLSSQFDNHFHFTTEQGDYFSQYATEEEIDFMVKRYPTFTEKKRQVEIANFYKQQFKQKQERV